MLDRRLTLLLFLALGILAGCMKEEAFTTSPDAVLRFSSDTVAFDTVISGVPANTRTFQVYNPNKRSIRIADVRLEKGSASVFRVNVDGTFLEGGRGGDFEIASSDSLRVFIEMTAPFSDSDEPISVGDKLLFRTEGGAEGAVTLTAYGQDVTPLKALVVKRDTILSGRRPYQIYDSLVVAEGAKLTLNAGVRLYFHPDASLIVRGTLRAEGQLGEEVMMRGDRLGNMFSNQPYDRIPGQWGGVLFSGESYGNYLNYTDIHSSQWGIRCDSSDVNREKLKVENSVIHNTQHDAVNLKSSNVVFGNTQITNAGGNCLTIVGGSSRFVHCTIANFYVFVGGRKNALNFSNFSGESHIPLYAAEFENCVITGYADDEIMGNRCEDESVAFNYSFMSCLLRTPAYDSEAVRECLWDSPDSIPNSDKNFPEFDLKGLNFSFVPDSASRAIGAANPNVTRLSYPFDRQGKERLLDGRSDMGCYEY